jgi:hypothetical protein
MHRLGGGCGRYILFAGVRHIYYFGGYTEEEEEGVIGATSATQLLCGASHGAQFVGGSDDADGAMPGQTMPTVPCLLCRNIIWVIIWPFFVFAVSHLLCTASSPPYFISYSVYWIIRANPATCRSPDEGAIEPSTGLTRERCHFLTFSIYRGHRAGARILGILAGRIGSTGSNIGRRA